MKRKISFVCDITPGESIRYWIRSDLVGSEQPIESDRIPGSEIASDPIGKMPKTANFTSVHLSSIRLYGLRHLLNQTGGSNIISDRI